MRRVGVIIAILLVAWSHLYASGRQLTASLDIGLIEDVVFSPNGAFIAAMGDSGMALLETGGLGPLSHRQGSAVSRRRPVSAFSDDSALLALLDASGQEIWLLDLSSWVWSRLPPLDEGGIEAIGFSNSGNLLAAGNRAGSIVVWDLETMQERYRFRSEVVRALTFAQDDALLVSGDGFRAVRFWDLRTRVEVFLGRHADNVSALLRHPFLPVVLSTAHDKTARLWSLDPVDSLATLRTLGTRVDKPRFSMDGQRLVIESGSSGYSGASVWQVAPPQKIAEFDGGRLSLLGFAPESHDIYTHLNSISGQGGPDDRDVVQRHAADDYTAVDTLVLSGWSPGFLRLAYSPQRHAMAYAYAEGDLHLVELGEPWEHPASPDTSISGRDTSPSDNGLHIGPARPNPFTETAIIDFSLAERGPFTIAVYDMAGQLVRTLASGTGAPGNHSVPWDGRGEGGRRLASGVYLCHLTMERGRKLLKMVLIH